ncbi:MAG: hypothetical protein MUE92_02015 [Chloroflexi bacterium]|nr:hypothetical protein [Chloroflexota bacterium]
MRSAAVPGFRPSVHGFRFSNRWPPGPTLRFGPLDPRVVGIGDASAGLCGGMVATVRDLFEAGLPPPPDTEPPPNGSPRFAWIVRRQVQSLDWLRVPLRYYDLQAFRPDPPAGLAALLRREPARVVALRDEWPRIRADIDANLLPVVGLVRVAGWSPRALTVNHQVLAWAYEEDAGCTRIHVYDPNHPGRDDVELRAELDPDGTRQWRERIRLVQSSGEPLLGFFRQPYAPPARALRPWR